MIDLAQDDTWTPGLHDGNPKERDPVVAQEILEELQVHVNMLKGDYMEEVHYEDDEKPMSFMDIATSHWFDFSVAPNAADKLSSEDEEILSSRLSVHPLDIHANILQSDVYVTEKDLDLLIPKFLYKPRPVVRKTIENTTLLGKIFQEAPLHNRVVSRYPQLNKRRIFEVVSTDTIFSSIPAYGGGALVLKSLLEINQGT